MPTSKFQTSLPFVLRWEGGFVDHPNDPGGRTNKGITQKVYDLWRVARGAPLQDVKLIADEDVEAIYEAGYWTAAHCESLDQPLHLAQFDTAVNMGVTRAVRFLQQAADCSVDGAFGSGTAKAVAACEPRATGERYCDIREAFYRRLVANKPELGVFLKGWLNRLNALREEVSPSGLESAPSLNFGDAGYIMKIPDIGEDPSFDQ